jgi:ferric-dicitrate binding protein FerR (iron transport regulator)
MKEGDISDRIMELAEKWLDGSITEQEKAEFSHWYNQFNDELATVPVSPAVLQRDMLKDILAKVHAEKQQPLIVTRPVRQWMRYAAVAAGLFLISSAGYFLLHKKGTGHLTPLTNKSHSIQDIPPGKKKAVLTLADGSGIVLDSAHNGAIALQGNAKVVKLSNGQLQYESAIVNRQSAVIAYNTLTTPKGGQYQLVLSDGSKVWLNAASSIRYPTAFTGNERRVEITGEAYFEVVHNSKMPFKVEKGEMTVEVLGTHFNINAYEDESAIQTTLLQGRVKVVNRPSYAKASAGEAKGKGQRAKMEQSVVLKPGQQAILSQTSHASQIIPVQTDEVLAWKNGLFQFHNAGLPAVLRQISRWYDVDIRYEGEMPVREFEGKIQRSLTLLQVLKILEKNQVHLTLQGRTIIVKNTI